MLGRTLPSLCTCYMDYCAWHGLHLSFYDPSSIFSCLLSCIFLSKDAYLRNKHLLIMDWTMILFDLNISFLYRPKNYFEGSQCPSFLCRWSFAFKMKSLNGICKHHEGDKCTLNIVGCTIEPLFKLKKCDNVLEAHYFPMRHKQYIKWLSLWLDLPSLTY